MEYPHVLYQMSENESFALQTGFSSITTERLETLFEESRRATSLIEDELRKRNSILVPTFRVNQILLKLRKDADLIKVHGRLDKNSNKCATALIPLMSTTHSDRSSRVFQEFLTDVLEQWSPQCAFLCGISIGKHKVASLRKEEKASLLKLLGIEKPSLSIEPFTSLANDYGIVKFQSGFDVFVVGWFVNEAQILEIRIDPINEHGTKVINCLHRPYLSPALMDS